MDMPEGQAGTVALPLWLVPGALWCVWFLWGVNWKKAWPALAEGGWLPVLLFMAVATLAWSRLQPESGTFLGLVSIPNVWWQLGSVCILVVLALFCGFVQGYFGWTPQEIDLEPPAPDDRGHVTHALAHDDHAHS